MNDLDAIKSGILINLLQSKQPISTSKLASHLSVTPRMVRYNLLAVEVWLKKHGVQLSRQQKVGLSLEINENERQHLIDEVSGINLLPGALTSVEREKVILLTLLSAPGPVYIQNLANKLLVCTATVTKNLNLIDLKLKENHLNLIRRPNYGLRVSGSEKIRRRMIADLLLDMIPSEWLLQIGRGLSYKDIIVLQEWPDKAKKANFLLEVEPLLEMLDLPESYRLEGLVEAELNISFPELAKVVLMLSLSIQRMRIRQNHPLYQEEVVVPPIDDVSLQSVIKILVQQIEKETGTDLPEAEKREMSLHVLGAETQPARQFVVRLSTEGSTWLEQLVDAMMAEVGQQLDQRLAGNIELREVLLAYLQPAIYRIRYKLPLYNPQAIEIKRMYPTIFKSAFEICNLMEPLTQTKTPEEEVGYVAMCLIAAVEGSILRRQPRVAVICPLGIATSKMLVSRLRKEFPSLYIVGVYSYENMETFQQENIDLIISTTAHSQIANLSDREIIHVNPLLYPADRAKILKWFQSFNTSTLSERG
ncbi:MAG: hypothetical protein CVU41_12795 [Chloroflexi bacterium HGW-Chloroflexi-3]|nr:MAG: hypothetical protein CVU41_12795 [Chloroflexi bacterium HGW-Chloroflexi-3]